MRRFFLKVLLTALAGTLLFAYLGVAEPLSPTGQGLTAKASAPETVIEEGSALYRSGDLEEALSVFRGFLIRHSDSPLTAKAHLFLARIFLDRGRYDECLLHLDRIPEERRGQEVQFIHGVALVETGRPQEGLAELLRLQNAPLFEKDRIRLTLAMAAANARLDQPLQAVSLYHRALNMGAEAKPVLARVHQIFEGRVSDTVLAEAAFMFKDTAIGQDAALQQAKRALAANENSEAKKLARQVVQAPTPFPYRREATQLLEQLTGESWLNRDRIGVILPLSGRYAPFGQLVKNGIELANRIDRSLPAPVEFVYRDSSAEAGKGAEAVSKLSLEDKVIAIIGPLSGNAATAAAERAEMEGVPLLTLSHKEGLPQIGDFIFRNSLTNRLQGRALARHAVLDLKITSFGVLAPQNRLGDEMTESFINEVEKLGGLVTDIERYDESATDFRKPILRLRGLDPATYEREQEEELSEEEILADLFEEEPPDFAPATFDALFIPDFAERVGLIAPQLPFYGLEDIQLLGINGWNSPELLRMAGQYVEDAILVDGFYAYSSYAFVKDFVNHYFETFGKEPTILEAQAFDAAGIMLSLLGDKSIRSRDDLRLALSQTKNYPGVTGATSFDFEGEADKILFLLKIHNGNIVQVDKASDRQP